MQPIHQFAALFGNEHQPTHCAEAFVSGVWVFSFSNWSIPAAESLSNGFGLFPQRDVVRLKAKVGQSSPLALNSAQLEDAKEFVSSLETYKSTDDAPNSLELTFEIEKHISEEVISIFSLPAFATTQQAKTLLQLHATFSVVCRSEKHFFIQLLDGSQAFETISLRLNTSKPIDRDLRRDELLAKRKDLCHFDGCIIPFLPEDYRLIKQSDQASLNEVFDRLCLMAILAFVADVSSLTDDGKFTFKLNGYRSVTGEITRAKISTKLVDEFFKIYQWVYADDHAADKLGLARNIISLHWKGTVSEPFEDGVYQSILSGYDVYLKKHVDQYIALKNKLSDYLSDFSQKSAKLADSVIEKLEKSFLAFAGFFISTILIKTVTDKTFPEYLPKPLQIIAWGLIGFSLLHGIVSLIFSLRDRTCFIEDFGLLRNRYADLLSKPDLDRILNCDEGVKKITGHLDFKLRLFYSGWLASLFLCSALVWQLSKQPNDSSKNSLPALAIPAVQAQPVIPSTNSSAQIKVP